MSKLSEELEFAKQKTDAFKKQEQEKRDAATKRINDMKNSIDELCKMVNDEMNSQISQLDSDIKLNGPYPKTWANTQPGDPPTREWTIKYKNFKDGHISAWSGHGREENEITLNGGWHVRKSVSCSKSDSGWSFVKKGKDKDSAEIACSLIEAVETTLSEAIYSMGHDSSKKD